MNGQTGQQSGVPLGGIGVGYFDIAADGQIKRVAINNGHCDGVLTDINNGTFLAAWESSSSRGSSRRGIDQISSRAWVLQRVAVTGAAGAAGVVRGIDDSSTSVFFVNSRILMVCTDSPLCMGVRCTPPVSSRFGSKLARLS